MRGTKRSAYIYKLVFMLTLIVVFALSAGVFQNTKVKAEKPVIKVGYVPGENFVKENDGQYTGYCVDYLEEIAMYTGWTYEYVSGTWEECLQRVESGEIDIVCMVQRTEDREKKLLFSNESMGDEYGLIYARNDSQIYYKDYRSMDGCTLALMAGTVFDGRVDELERMYGIKFKRVYFGTATDTMNALKNGQTDLAIVGSIFGENGAKIVGRDDAMPYYCVTTKNNIVLMKQFNDALRQVKLNDASIESRLYQKYYSEDKISSKPLFTKAEVEFIKSSGEVVVKLVTGNQPLCYNEGERISGIFIDYLNLLAEKTGLKIRVEEVKATELGTLMQGFSSESHLLLRSKRAVDYNGLENGLVRSDVFIETELSYVMLKENVDKETDKQYVLAATKEKEYYLPSLIQRSDMDYEVKYYDTIEQCMEAVIDNEADIVIGDSYLIDFIMKKPEYADKLTEVMGEEVINGMCLIGSSSQSTLLEIFDKAMAHIPENKVKSIVDKELGKNTYKWQFGDFVYAYWNWIIFLIVVLLVAFGVYAIQMRRMAKMHVRRKEYELLQQKVQQDEVTGIYNKKYFYEKASEMIAQSKEEMCIVTMDIINFKMVNDMFGLGNGDRLLMYMAQDLIETLEGKDILLARFNADHFYMCMSVADFKEIPFVRKYKRTPVENIDIRVAYGVYMVGDNKELPVNIMCDMAAIAVHEKAGKSDEYIFYYTEDDRQRMLRQQEIERDMERALERREFRVYIQPKYDIHKNRIVGGEALARWEHPEKGIISPGEFIPVFEKNGFIRFLDYFIWEETCKVISTLRKHGYDKYPISINVSRAHFYRNEFQHVLEELIEIYNISIEDLEIEITESIYVEDSDLINTRIQELRDMGFKIAMDDFGSGYSSLNMLKEIPIDIIKMDLKFLDSEDNIDKSHKILDSLVGLAKRLDLKVVIEGVETKEQVKFLQGIGEMSAQGYYYAKSLERKKYEELIILDNVT